MKQISRGILVLAALSAATALPARAQSLLDQHQVTVKVGANFPTRDNVRDAGTTWLMGGLEYAFNDQSARQIGSVEVDYAAIKGDRTPVLQQTIRERYHVWSLMYNYKIRRVNRHATDPGAVVFYGAGIGADLTRVKVTDPNPGGGGDLSKRNTVGAANLFVGYELASNLQLEARYHLAFGSVAERKMNSIQLLAGMRF